MRRSRPTEVMYQAEQAMETVQPTRSSKTTVNTLKGTSDKVPITVPYYKFIQESSVSKRPTTEDIEDIGMIKSVQVTKSLFDFDHSLNEPSLYKSTLYGEQDISKEILDKDNMHTSGKYKTIAKERMNKPDPFVTNKAKKTFRSGYQVYDPNFVAKGVDKLMLMGCGQDIFKPHTGKVRFKIGGIQSMTRLKYNAQFEK